MTKLSTLAAGALIALAAHSAYAASVCPILTGGNAGGGGGVLAAYIANSGVTNGGCNVLITFNLNGSIVTTFPNPTASYDNGGDDNMVGIINNTNSPITAVNLTGITVPFAFDGDGACDPTWTFAGGNPCGTTSSGYGHQGVTFSGIASNFNSGTISFSGGIAGGGGSNWFSLEGPVDLNLQVSNGAPEPATLALLGTGLVGLGLTKRRLRKTR